MKIPIDYAWNELRHHLRGFLNVQPIQRDAVARVAESGLVRVTQLKPLFKDNSAYRDWRRGIHVPDRQWERLMNRFPDIQTYARRQMRINPNGRAASPQRYRKRCRSRSRSPSPIRRKNASSNPRGRLRMLSRLGAISAAERRATQASILSVQRKNDECDDQDVNLPKPICKAVRKACRTYGANHQYIRNPTDGTEMRDYELEINYQ